MSGEVVYRKVSDERIEVLREGDWEAQYVCRPVYETYRRDEPGQTFERMGLPRFGTFEEAVAACVLDANEVAFSQGLDDSFDGGLSFYEDGRDGGEWFAREYDTIGSDWRIERVGWSVWDQFHGGDPVMLESTEELPAFIESEIDKGWF